MKSSASPQILVRIGTLNIMPRRPIDKAMHEGADTLEAFFADLKRLTQPEVLDADETERSVREPLARTLIMTTSVHAEILEQLTNHEPEVGGALIGPRNHPIVTHFLFDEGATVSPTSYTPDHAGLNASLPRFREANLEMKGLVHSHPPGAHLPSLRDVAYVRLAFNNPRNRVEQYLLPIVCEGRLYPYVLTRESVSEPGATDHTARLGASARLFLV